MLHWGCLSLAWRSVCSCCCTQTTAVLSMFLHAASNSQTATFVWILHYCVRSSHVVTNFSLLTPVMISIGELFTETWLLVFSFVHVGHLDRVAISTWILTQICQF